MNDTTVSIVRWLIGLPIRLLVALCLAGLLLVLAMHSGFMVAGVLRNLLLLVLLAGYTWAVYFGFPFFRQRTRQLRIFLSAGLALMLLCLTGSVAALVMNAALSGKSDQRVESVTLPSGENQIESLDLENNVLTVKRVPWNAKVESPEFRDFPDYLAYSAIGYNGRSGYQFPWIFDEARTRAKNGPRWGISMPFKMALDYSVITFPPKAGFRPHEGKRDVALAHAGAKEIAAKTLELSDQELRGAECKYTVLTNAIIDKIVAIYGYACSQTNRFYVVWEPLDPATAVGRHA